MKPYTCNMTKHVLKGIDMPFREGGSGGQLILFSASLLKMCLLIREEFAPILSFLEGTRQKGKQEVINFVSLVN